MADAREVGELFDSKAAGWQAKYRQGGPLAARLEAFETALARRVPAPADVLDFGCGTGDLAAHLARLGHRVSAGDIAARMLEEARRAHEGADVRWTKLEPDAERLPFDEGSFDAVVASSVLEYVDHLAPLLREFHRILQPKGALVFTVPNPEAPVRRVEAAARPLAKIARSLPWPRSLARFDRYAQYLVVSKNRLPVAGWIRQLASAGFAPAPGGVRPPGPFASRRSPLMLLAFERLPG